ncbi:hypothetical protein [Arcticibacter sp. MXS-1]|uniref:hypothetical protein n=1 Tax=Arcticibacter sp. MXS-1 TaxID=3341726 RepID=UPI0035A9638E
MEEQGAPGAAWQIGGGHTVRTGYFSNEADGLSGSGRWARLYEVTIDASGGRTLTMKEKYGKNELYVNETKDENWKEGDGKAGLIPEFKDKEDRVVLKRTWKDESTPLSTYYVYDDFGNLCFVLPPKAEPDNGQPSADAINELCYQYRYDERNRMSRKKLPGKGWEYLVYNKLDQVVATQDAEQRKRKEWLITKYDGLGRVVMTGFWNNGNVTISPEDLRTQVYATLQWDERKTGQVYGYELRTYPTSLTIVLTVNYYDDYEIPDLPAAYNKKDTYSKMIHSLLTASRTAVLNNPSDMLWNVNYYDDDGRVVKNFSEHYKGGTRVAGNYDETDNTYSFTDELKESSRSHKVGGTEQLKIVTGYDYDHRGRKVNTWETMGGSRVLLAQNVYNEIGQLKEKRLHSGDGGNTFLQKIAYKYNERGWLKQMNHPDSLSRERAFGMTLAYGDHSTEARKQYNGNISGVNWQTRVPASSGFPQQSQSYDYSYDKLNRLELAAYNASGKTGFYNESISYDKGGNIQSLSRTGEAAPGLMN